MTASSNGFGKCTNWLNSPQRKREGVIAMHPAREMETWLGRCRSSGLTKLLISNLGTLQVRTSLDEISVLGRNTQGVKLINLKDGESLNSVERIFDEDGESDPEA